MPTKVGINAHERLRRSPKRATGGSNRGNADPISEGRKASRQAREIVGSLDQSPPSEPPPSPADRTAVGSAPAPPPRTRCLPPRRADRVLVGRCCATPSGSSRPSPFGPDRREDRTDHREGGADQDGCEQRDDGAKGAERLRVLVERRPDPERRGGDRPAEDEGREQRPGQEGAKRDLAMEQGRGVQSQKTIEPPIQSGSATASRSRGVPRRPEHDRQDAAQEEEPDRVPQLVGHAAHVDTPSARIHVLVELPDRDPQIRKPITTATEAAETLSAVVPNRSRTISRSPRRASCA